MCYGPLGLPRGTELKHYITTTLNGRCKLCRVNSLELYVALSVVKPVWVRGVVRSFLYCVYVFGV